MLVLLGHLLAAAQAERVSAGARGGGRLPAWADSMWLLVSRSSSLGFYLEAITDALFKPPQLPRSTPGLQSPRPPAAEGGTLGQGHLYGASTRCELRNDRTELCISDPGCLSAESAVVRQQKTEGDRERNVNSEQLMGAGEDGPQGLEEPGPQPGSLCLILITEAPRRREWRR